MIEQLDDLIRKATSLDEKTYLEWVAQSEKEFPLHDEDGNLKLKWQYNKEPSAQYRRLHEIYLHLHWTLRSLEDAKRYYKQAMEWQND